MKHTTIFKLSQFFILIFTGCTSIATVSPSQETQFKEITSSQNHTKIEKSDKKGYMQRALDEWLEEEWTPTVENDTVIQKKYMKKEKIKRENKEVEVLVQKRDRDFTLQEYVDKASAYLKAHPSDYENSHVKKLESLPVIGK